MLFYPKGLDVPALPRSFLRRQYEQFPQLIS